MHILGKSWSDGYLDYHRSDDEVRIATKAWWTLERLNDVYLQQPRSLRRVFNYLREVGIVTVLSKIRSRLRESLRDRRVLAVGIGEVVEGGEEFGYTRGSPVVFVAPCHPECLERLVLPGPCTAEIPTGLYERFSAAGGIYLFEDCDPQAAADWTEVAGWSRFAGRPLPASASRLLPWARQEFQQLDTARARLLPLGRPTPVTERVEPARTGAGDLSAVIFGLGHYAKINVIRNLHPRIRVDCVHEIDPTQIGARRNPSVAYDSCSQVREAEDYQVYLINGYHHTHADLAVHALRSGAYTVVEKPLVTTPDQLDRLLAAMRDHPGRFFACFQMRYNVLWQLARRDLQLSAGQPVHYHCIVFETPLPRRHWYNWVNSGSRLISNGCHWLDHFLFINAFAAVARYDLWKGGNGDLHVSVELENGAVFGMCLTDVGSPRIGMQQHVELRAHGGTVTVENGARYVAENRHGIVRRKRINKPRRYKFMYTTIYRKIVAGEQGDSIRSVERSCRLMLDLERVHQQMLQR